MGQQNVKSALNELLDGHEVPTLRLYGQAEDRSGDWFEALSVVVHPRTGDAGWQRISAYGAAALAPTVHKTATVAESTRIDDFVFVVLVLIIDSACAFAAVPPHANFRPNAAARKRSGAPGLQQNSRSQQHAPALPLHPNESHVR